MLPLQNTCNTFQIYPNKK
uniref:Uncharacterized protein n=1 Tax=Arundo donax TaxID=35708 RepID=A0A0A9BSW1_ARUDO